MKKIVYILLAVVLLTSCGGDKKSRKLIFKYNQSSGISSLDPAYAKDQANIWAVNQMFNGLVQINSKLEIEPCIAKSWTISDDGLTYTFDLRDDVFFHDHEAFEGKKGRKVVAQDFVYSFERMMDAAKPGSWLFVGRVIEDNPFMAIGDNVLEIKLKAAFRPFLGILSMQYCSVVPKEVAEKYGKDFRRNPIGTGPFKFKQWEEGVVLIMLKNENYFEKVGEQQLPYLDGIKVTFAQNKRTEFLEFLEGKQDFISGIDASYKDELIDKNGNLMPANVGKIVMNKSPYLNTEYLGFLVDTENPLLKDNPIAVANIRKAINYGFDRNKMVRFLRNNVGSPANAGFIPKGLPAFDAEKVQGYKYNPEQAIALLKEAGFPNGEGLPEITLFTNPSYIDFCTYIQSQLSEIGVKIKIETMPPGNLRDKMAKSEVVFFRGSWIADYPDAESYLAMFYSKYPPPPNYTRFANAEFDALYENALGENDDAKRYTMYQKMDQIIMDNAPVVPLYYDEVVRLTKPYVKGLEDNAINLLVLKTVRFERAKK